MTLSVGRISLANEVSKFEKETCDKLQWAHNALMDEDSAPVQGPRWILLDQDDHESID
jgi:hypothetical protein